MPFCRSKDYVSKTVAVSYSCDRVQVGKSAARKVVSHRVPSLVFDLASVL